MQCEGALGSQLLDLPINKQTIENENDPVGTSEVVPVNRIVGVVVLSC